MAASSSIPLQTASLCCALLPLLSRQARFTANLARPHQSPSNFRLFSSASSSKPPIMAQAKRGLSVGEDKVASPSDLHYEAPLRIVEYPDPILRARNKHITTFDENLKKLVHEMFDVMYKTDGIGLSAPQVGINVQLLVFNPAGERGIGEELVLINPKVHKYSKKAVLFNEGCLSFPGIYADVEALEKKFETRTGLPSPEKIEKWRRRKEATGFGRS